MIFSSSMKFLFVLRKCIAFSLLIFSIQAFAQDAIPDFYREPGLNPNRSYVNQNFNEHIDPFSGALQHHYVDLHLPGNGGFDLKVIRSYNSASVDPANLDGYQSNAGVGWNIHFGRVLKNNDTNFCANSFISVAKNPVLELPDGSRQILATSSSPSTALLMTTQRWKADCIANGLAVYSPDGTRYDMTQFATVSGGASPYPVYAIYTTKITDKNGNYANITYASGNAQISSVSTNDGRTVSFTYADSGLYTRRISSISSAGQTYSYGYQPVSQYTGKYYLAAVTRPGGTSWKYSYNGNLGTSAGSFAMNRAIYPQGGYVNYGYAYEAFDAQANPSYRTTVVSSKSVSTGGSWSFSYAPGASGSFDTTTVSSPAGTTVYKHVGPNYSTSGTVWMVGLLMSKTIGGVQSESYEWSKQSISNQNNLRPGQFLLKVDTGAVYAPILTKKTIARSGATHATTYSNFDSYGNAGTITESGTYGGNRTTSLSYYINTAKWILNQVKNESFTGSSVVRSFDSNGNLTSITRDGISTSYDYDGQGNVISATFPRGLVHNYSNFIRGIAQSETQPAGVSLSRTVSDSGNVTTETNGDGRSTYYSYDGLNRVTLINYPVGNNVSISYGAASKAVQRGALQEVTSYDGFGRTIGITLGGIGRTFTYDALGRKTFESNPGDTSGTRYGYDILDRVTSIVNSDGTSQLISYGAGTKTIRNERGLTTAYTYRAYGNPDQQFLMSTDTPVAATDLLMTRNSKDLITAVTQGGFARGYGYNSNYYLTAVTNPETGTTTYGRDAAGNMTSRSVGASGTTSYTYDGQNRLTSVVYPGSTPAVTNTYNKTNRLKSANSSTANRTYDYDGNGNLLNETLTIDSKNFTVGYSYNGNDQLSTVAYPNSGSVINYSPNALGRPTQVSGYVTGVTYWPSGQIRQINYANGTVSNYSQNSRLWPSSFSTQKTGTYLNNNSYTYDGIGNLVTISDSVDSSYNRSLGYDGVNRLTTANGSWGSGSISYSGVGNISNQVFGGSGLSYAYDGNNRLTSISGAKSASYSYDGYGNIVADSSNNYTYDGVPNLRCVNCANPSASTQYQYDGTNQRVSATKGGVKNYEMFDSQGKQLITATTQGNAIELTEFFYLGGKRIAQKSLSQLRYTISSLTADLSPAGLNQAVILTAIVSGTNPTGTVTFYDGNRVLGTATVINGKATLSVSFASIGEISLTASYFEGFSGTPTVTSAVIILPIVSNPQPREVFRFRNNSIGSYLLTASTLERDAILTSPSWSLEGLAFKVHISAISSDLNPVYRFRNDFGGYFYTISQTEKDYIVANFPSYHYEGIAWYGKSVLSGNVQPLYRFYNSGNGTHFFTASQVEKDYIVSSLPTWTYEGISHYVWPSGSGVASQAFLKRVNK
jgi:YD repeat-containing protein